MPPLQQWSFVALVISPQSAVIYLCNTGGVQSATNAIAHTAEAFNTSTLIGGDTADGGNGGRTFNGSMDEVAVFNASLSQQQVLNLYYNGVVPHLRPQPRRPRPPPICLSAIRLCFPSWLWACHPFSINGSRTDGPAWGHQQLL